MKSALSPMDRELRRKRIFSVVEPWLYLLPFFLGLTVFTLYPVVNVVFMSF